MNIFYLHNDPKICAQHHVDKHVVKMIVEYAQLLSTAHRIIDGKESIALSKSGRKQKVWSLSDEREEAIYKATHINHPSAKWARHNAANYHWLAQLWVACLEEYTYRYGKVHSCDRLVEFLTVAPYNIEVGEFSPPWRAMPDEYKVARDVEDYTVKSYRAYYNGAKSHMFKWKLRNQPEWANGLSAS